MEKGGVFLFHFTSIDELLLSVAFGQYNVSQVKMTNIIHSGKKQARSIQINPSQRSQITLSH